MSILKFIIVQDATARELPIFFPQAIQHSEMVPAGTVPVSAGFVYLDGPKGFGIPEIGSETLNLNPRPKDKALIRAALERN